MAKVSGQRKIYEMINERIICLFERGEKGFPVVFWKWVEVQDPESESEKKRVPFLRYYTVFNLEQTEGIDIPDSQTRDFNPIKEAEKVAEQ